MLSGMTNRSEFDVDAPQPWDFETALSALHDIVNDTGEDTRRLTDDLSSVGSNAVAAEFMKHFELVRAQVATLAEVVRRYIVDQHPIGNAPAQTADRKITRPVFVDVSDLPPSTIADTAVSTGEPGEQRGRWPGPHRVPPMEAEQQWPVWRLTWQLFDTVFSALTVAASESAARQAWIEQDYGLVENLGPAVGRTRGLVEVTMVHAAVRPDARAALADEVADTVAHSPLSLVMGVRSLVAQYGRGAVARVLAIDRSNPADVAAAHLDLLDDHDPDTCQDPDCEETHRD